MLLAVLFACYQNSVTETNTKRVSAASEKPNTAACAPEPAWERIFSQVIGGDPTPSGRITLEGALTDSACELRLELRDAAAVRLLGVTIPDTRGPGATSSSATAEAPIGTLELWVAAIGLPDASATYTYKIDVVESRAKSR